MLLAALTINQLLLYGSILAVVGLFLSKTGFRFGLPTLLLFLGVGMVAGSTGFYSFNDPVTAQAIGTVALVIILFTGGMDTSEYYGIMENEDGKSMKDMGEFIIAKHRNGRVGTVLLRFQSNIIKFASAVGYGVPNGTGSFSSKMNQQGTSSAQGRDPMMDGAPDSGFTI